MQAGAAQFRWRQALPTREAADLLDATTQVRIVLNVAAWVGNPARIYMVMPSVAQSNMSVQWATAGTLLPGHLSGGQRQLIFQGVIAGERIEDTLRVTASTDAGGSATPSRVKFTDRDTGAMSALSSWVRRATCTALWGALASLVPWASAPCHAQFAAAVTPPRFELNVQAGEVTRQVMEITHAVPGTGSYRVDTADWNMDPSGALTFHDTLQPGSCRPWVAIERRDIAVAHGARLRYRFEIVPPATATPQECRFALMIESKPQEVKTSETASFPMNGRIGVIVYASIGGAKAQLEPGALSIGTIDGRRTPVLLVHNAGNATARLAGMLKGVDSSAATFEFSPEAVPILPGQTRAIGLQRFEAAPRTAAAGKSAAVPTPIHWPLGLRGTLEYGPGAASRIEVDRSVGESPAQ